MDLLSSRVWTFDEFLMGEERFVLEGRDGIQPIPILLAPQETREEYEQAFEEYLRARNVSLTPMQSSPHVERNFRMDFANLRFMEFRRQNLIGFNPSNRDLVVESRNSSENQGYRGLRSRDELLAQTVVSPPVFLSAMTDFGPNGHIRTDRALRAIAVVLKPGETREQYENNFQRWLFNKKKVKLGMLKDDERRFRQCFAHAMVRDLKYRVRTHPQAKRSSNFQVSGQILKRPRIELNVANADLMTGKEEVESVTVPGAKDPTLSEGDDVSCSSSTTLSEPPLTPRSDAEALETTNDSCTSCVKLEPPQQDFNKTLLGNNGTIFVDQRYAMDAAIHADMEILRRDIYQIASDLVVEADSLKVDSTAQQLTQSSHRIRLNEKAIQDSLSYLGDSSTEAAELARQVDELKVALNKEREHRDGVLACFIANERSKSAKLEKKVFENQLAEIQILHQKDCCLFSKSWNVFFKKYVICGSNSRIGYVGSSPMIRTETRSSKS